MHLVSSWGCDRILALRERKACLCLDVALELYKLVAREVPRVLWVLGNLLGCGALEVM